MKRMNEISNPVGRPTVFDESTLNKLEYGFAHGLTDSQACLYAGISPASLYNYQNAHPEYLERKEQLKNSITMRAKLNVADKINDGDIAQSNWWLERKAKDEFSTRTENINANVNLTDLPDEEKDKIKSIIDGNAVT